MGIHRDTHIRWLERARASSCCRVRDKSSTQKVDAGFDKEFFAHPLQGRWMIYPGAGKLFLEGPCV